MTRPTCLGIRQYLRKSGFKPNYLYYELLQNILMYFRNLVEFIDDHLEV